MNEMLPILTLAACLLGMTACAPISHYQTSEGTTTTPTRKNRNPGNIKILWSHEYDEEGLLIVKGCLGRKDHSAVSIPVHVHVLVLSSKNQVTQSLQTSTLYLPRNRTGRGGNWTRFEVRSSAVPKPGSRIQVTVSYPGRTPQ